MLAAVYLDGGIAPARRAIRVLILGNEDELSASRDYKTALQELVQRESGQKLAYRLVGEEGPDHAKRFSVEVEMCIRDSYKVSSDYLLGLKDER